MKGQRIFYFLMAWLMVATFGYALALPFPQKDKQEVKRKDKQKDKQEVRQKDKKLPKAQPIQVDEDTIPDSLLHPVMPSSIRSSTMIPSTVMSSATGWAIPGSRLPSCLLRMSI